MTHMANVGLPMIRRPRQTSANLQTLPLSAVKVVDRLPADLRSRPGRDYLSAAAQMASMLSMRSVTYRDRGYREVTVSYAAVLFQLFLAGTRRPQGMRQVSLIQAAGMPRSTLRSNLDGLGRGGLVFRDHTTKKYHLTDAAMEIEIELEGRFRLCALRLCGAMEALATIGNEAPPECLLAGRLQ